ncbi:hypothetical protein HTV45_28625 [Streptomyces sp. CHD11]|uniref:alpha/beta hydrolase family protein n=1 Tax=Streptomyces sp. CHD11 TaxID=2741325 RepID=UPI001BFC502E|nr:hypothetical protein [Streptomyces sp. CHD11]MBT3154791.1 hypothetical protein [Streptomyces sp. CHD11]
MKPRTRAHTRTRATAGGALIAALLLGASLTGTTGTATAAGEAGTAGTAGSTLRVAAGDSAVARTGTVTGTVTGTGTVTEYYDLGDTAFTDSVSGTVSEIRAVVHRPRRLSGKLPLVVISHGSWYACTDPDAQSWPCDRGEPYPSHLGYDYLGRALAARGYVVVSLSADGINMVSFDYGDRARIINEHLRLWRELDSGGGPLADSLPSLRGHVDLERVGTIGHSRGGKGVMWQASDKHRDEIPDGVRVGAVLALAPVKFDPPGDGNADALVTRTPVAVVTSGCDGAVHEQGQEYLDDVVGLTTEPAYSVSLRDGNHNYFNTRWTPPAPLGEDDSTCPDRELAPAPQQNALTVYATAFFDKHLGNDPSGEPVLTGERPLPDVVSTTRVVQPARAD